MRKTTVKQNEGIEPLDLTLILKDYEDKWVVLSPDNSKVIAAGDTFDSIMDALKDGFALKVPRFVPLIPNVSN